MALSFLLSGGGYVGDMLGWFNDGNAAQYSPQNSRTVDSTLKGKTIIFLGSSVTCGYGAKGDSFVDYLVAQDGIKAVEEAKSGTTLVDSGSSSYISRMKKIDPNIKADAFVCQLSTNDATKGKPIGSVTQSFDIEDYDTNTVVGAIEYIVAYVGQTWHCPVIFYTGTRYDSELYGDMVDQLAMVKNKWDIGVINLWSNDEMNGIAPELREQYMTDDIHPTRRGYRDWWTPVMRKYMQDYLRRS